MQTLEQWLSFIEHLHSKTIDMGLERMNKMIKKMDIKFDVPVFTVGGTNGKGSICSYLEHILQAQGYKVGVHTSPHLIRFNERAKVNGQYIADEEFCKYFEEVEKARGELTLSYFEYTLLAILKLFQEKHLDAVILEIGLGGRLDAVNTVDPTVSIIASIGIDHTAYLGNTREEIAWDKAHIYRHNKPAICGDKNPPETLISYAKEIGALLEINGKDFEGIKTGDNSWNYAGPKWKLNDLPLPSMKGVYQINNASAALAALEAVEDQIEVDRSSIETGLKTALLSGRFQKIQSKPEIIVDVGHNPHAAVQLAETLKANPIGGKTYAVFGMLSDKDREKVCSIMGSCADCWMVCDLPGERGGKAEDLQKCLIKEGVADDQIKIFANVEYGLQNALKTARSTDRILVFGSFVTVSAALTVLKVPVL
ncbi:bifunctional tetrahydrofolate synthase/dihydrofolate synthase [Turicimonas muris]|uniref:bifunctional tetrahydrofolate synthase/dihydrofolate synthase n=3 Tax=Turicimonas muris TaxID=1796652 RepID=UPI002494056C|nr:bifunctional tetrahydrofolate synthase/dihydrofolate synthase [Turicimonas muris]